MNPNQLTRNAIIQYEGGGFYLKVVGKGINSHLEAYESTYLGRFWIRLCEFLRLSCLVEYETIVKVAELVHEKRNLIFLAGEDLATLSPRLTEKFTKRFSRKRYQGKYHLQRDFRNPQIPEQHPHLQVQNSHLFEIQNPQPLNRFIDLSRETEKKISHLTQEVQTFISTNSPVKQTTLEAEKLKAKMALFLQENQKSLGSLFNTFAKPDAQVSPTQSNFWINRDAFSIFQKLDSFRVHANNLEKDILAKLNEVQRKRPYQVDSKFTQSFRELEEIIFNLSMEILEERINEQLFPHQLADLQQKYQSIHNELFSIPNEVFSQVSGILPKLEEIDKKVCDQIQVLSLNFQSHLQKRHMQIQIVNPKAPSFPLDNLEQSGIPQIFSAKDLKNQQFIRENELISLGIDEIHQLTQFAQDMYKIQEMQEGLKVYRNRLNSLKEAVDIQLVVSDKEIQRLEDNIAYLFNILSQMKVNAFVQYLTQEEYERVVSKNQCMEYEKITKDGLRKSGFIFFNDPYTNGAWKEVRRTSVASFDPKNSFKRKQLVASAQGRKMRKDFAAEREGLFHLHQKDGVNVVPDRLCDYSSGQRTPQTFVLERKQYHLYKCYERGTLQENIAYFQQSKELMVKLLLDLFHNVRAAHRHGCFHGDLSPKNILVDPQDRSVIMDIAGLLSVADDDEIVHYTPLYTPLHFFRRYNHLLENTTMGDRKLLDLFAYMRCIEDLIWSNSSPKIYDQQTGQEENLLAFFNRLIDKTQGKSLYWGESDYGMSTLFSSEILKNISKTIAAIKNKIEFLMAKNDQVAEEGVAQIALEIETFVANL